MNEQDRINLLTPRNPLPEPDTASPNKGRRFFLIVLVVLATLGAVHLLSRNSNAKSGRFLTPGTGWSLTTVKNFIFPGGVVLAGQEEDRVNILLLGIGGSGHDGAYLSDTNIILSFKPSTKEVALISIPRDLAVNIPGYGYRKINSADAIGETKQPGQGGDYARQIFADNFGLSIPYYLRVDFKAFNELVDQVGGVTITVDKSFTDYSYPGPNDSYKTVSFTAGTQTMNGEQALTYSRSRHGNNGEGSDFARSRRQQQVLVALKEKMLSAGTYLNPLRVQGIYDSLTSNIATNLSLDQLMYLASVAKDTNQNAIRNLVIDDSPGGLLAPTTGEGGAFLLTPKTGTFGPVNSAILGIFDATSTPAVVATGSAALPVTPLPNPAFAKATIEIQNGTWQVGLAARVKKTLEGKGFSVTTVGNSSIRPVAKTSLYLLDGAVNQELLTDLQKELQLEAKALPTQPADDMSSSTGRLGPADPNSDLLIVIGEDYLTP